MDKLLWKDYIGDRSNPFANASNKGGRFFLLIIFFIVSIGFLLSGWLRSNIIDLIIGLIISYISIRIAWDFLRRKIEVYKDGIYLDKFYKWSNLSNMELVGLVGPKTSLETGVFPPWLYFLPPNFSSALNTLKVKSAGNEISVSVFNRKEFLAVMKKLKKKVNVKIIN